MKLYFNPENAVKLVKRNLYHAEVNIRQTIQVFIRSVRHGLDAVYAGNVK